MLLLSHPTGNTFSRAAARAFHARGLLQEFDTCFIWNPDSPLARLLPPSLVDQLNRRSFVEIPGRLQHSHPWRELLRLSAVHHALPWLKRHERGPLSVDGVYRSFDRHVAARLPSLEGLQAVYAYEDAAFHTFRSARALGLRRYYDLPIGHWRSAQRIFAEERDLQPSWACTLTGLRDSPDKLARKDEELALADSVIVPSQFVRSTLLDHPSFSSPVHVVPFGSPPALREPPPTPTSGPLRVLYVGSLGQRKGLSYLLDAIKALGSQLSLTLIGRPTSPDCAPLNAALQSHPWIPSLPNAAILAQMSRHDVLVLPSLFEGFALVISEALSQGLPVIATPNSGATESVRDGKEGFLVPIRSSQAIAERLQWLVDHREQLAAMREACLDRARELSWTVYEDRLCASVRQAGEPAAPLG
ncbi:MAG: glycosyltransferase family 4 protein [Cyanobacteriota bacterium]